ncbi:MAG: hypothetical protein HZB41_01360, partial [Ignavibacteriae bacterium]|nr:hypothetical protein [Ignavibacteriota bacterium]
MTEEKIKNSTEIDILNIISKSKKITITTHVSPDGDAIGSELAMFFYCQHKGINTSIINHSETPYNLKFLNGIENVKVFDKSEDIEFIKNSDTILFLDLNNSSRVKDMEESVLSSNAV